VVLLGSCFALLPGCRSGGAVEQGQERQAAGPYPVMALSFGLLRLSWYLLLERAPVQFTRPATREPWYKGLEAYSIGVVICFGHSL
jgi:hypothetical protein